MPVDYKKQELKHKGKVLSKFLTLKYISSLDFELIEDEIDIDSIEEIEEFELDQFINMDNAERFDRTMIEYSKINSIIRWAKQADKEIKSIKEK